MTATRKSSTSSVAKRATSKGRIATSAQRPSTQKKAVAGIRPRDYATRQSAAAKEAAARIHPLAETTTQSTSGTRKTARPEPWKARLRTTDSASQTLPAVTLPHIVVALREGTKGAVILGLLQREDGATIAEMIRAIGWQAHSVRGFLSGTLRKKHGLAVASVKDEAGERRYRVAR
jgi:hypothetical protein